MALMRTQEASFSSSRCTYQVFLSFRGVDTRKTFTSHLHTALVQAGFHTFRDDDEIERGNNIKSELKKAIQQSRISIIVFSKNYASSRWCLDELLMILERKQSSNHVVLPVFYHVDPSQVRYQSGSIGEAFDRYEEKLKTETNDERKKEFIDKVGRWKGALREVADLFGMELKDQDKGDESEFIQKVVTEVQHKLNRKVLDVAPYLVGIHDRTRKIDLWLRDGSTSVSIMMICGMGGIGKTTIAKFVFNKNLENFDGSSFLMDINEQSKTTKGFIGLQNQLLSDICKWKKEEINNIDEGIITIQDALCCKKVLLVLDDVYDFDQLYGILGMQDWFHPGSKIIITTRQESVLTPNDVYEVYKVQEMDHNESIKLFSLHAFKQDHPSKIYTEYTKRVVQYCGGLPLALKVLGRSLSGQNVNVWGNALEKLESIPNGQILKKLKVSLQSLPDDDVEKLFLHIACFFVGKDQDWTVMILEACGFYPTVGIANLIDRHLLTIDYYNRLMMHNLVRDMGREIIRQESSNPGERSRLWHHKDCFSVLRDKTGSNSIQAFVYDMKTSSGDNLARSISIVNTSYWTSALNRLCCNCLAWFSVDNYVSNSYNVDFKTEAFASMQQIKFLQLNFVKLTGGYKNFPNGLRWLCWHGFHLNFMPNDFPLDSLIGLDLQYSSLKHVWKRSKFLPCLKTLNLSHSEWLEGTPKFSEFPNLEILILKGCVRLVEVCESIEFAERLLVLDLENCKKLTKLPRKLDMLRKLERLIISGCSSLCEFPMGLRNLDSLKEFRADGINMNSTLALTRVVQQQASLPRFLSELSLVGCNLSNDSFPTDFSNLSSLMRLNLSENLIETLPNCIRSLGRLEDLILDDCPRLQFIVGLPSTVRNIWASDNRSLKRVETTPNFVQTYCLGCRELVEVERLFKSVPITNCDIKILKKLGLFDMDLMLTSKYTVEFYNAIKVVYEYGIFSTSVPGCVPPAGCYFVSAGYSVTFTVPSLPNIRGLNVCVVYRGGWSDRYRPAIKMHNETKDFSWEYIPNFWNPNSYKEYFMMLSHWKSGNALEGGDRVVVSVVKDEALHYRLVVEKIGIKVVYDDEDEEDEENRPMSCKSTTYLSVVNEEKIGFKVVCDYEEEEDEENKTMSCKSSSYLSWTEKNTPPKLSDFHVTGTDYYLDSTDLGTDYYLVSADMVTSSSYRYYYEKESCAEQRNRHWVRWNGSRPYLPSI